jgi:predicted aspartyl protease
MGMFKKRVKVSNSKKPELFFEEEFWIDTGALFSFVPEDCLLRIGVEPSATRNLVLADGRQEARLLGFCDFQVEGLEGVIPCPVIFAPKGSLLLLGATALENFGVEVDPINKRLKPILAVIGGAALRREKFDSASDTGSRLGGKPCWTGLRIS